ncbi:hypothetical protein PIB30_052377 [Stylosanthes scabra]|uniref:Uncharacterized protein n=1 Tax=Stylosanthes scabra TaxID=79078 RepID=A0ABU6VH36_9FABA|nr:hypothetical protein [Stylosanthes scabra]
MRWWWLHVATSNELSAAAVELEGREAMAEPSSPWPLVTQPPFPKATTNTAFGFISAAVRGRSRRAPCRRGEGEAQPLLNRSHRASFRRKWRRYHQNPSCRYHRALIAAAAGVNF